MDRFEISLEDLYKLLGERLVIQYRLEQELKLLHGQAENLAHEMTKLKFELESRDGKLVESTDNNTVRRFSS